MIKHLLTKNQAFLRDFVREPAGQKLFISLDNVDEGSADPKSMIFRNTYQKLSI